MIGAWLGARTYHSLSDRNFGDVVLGLLFLSGIGLVWSSIGHVPTHAWPPCGKRRMLYAGEQTR